MKIEKIKPIPKYISLLTSITPLVVKLLIKSSNDSFLAKSKMRLS